MNQPIVVTGIQTGIPPHPTEIDYPVRQEWSKFAASRDNVTLYVKALEAMMDLPQDSFPPVSFFQISGIHGYPPNVPWDGAEPPPNGGIYCYHQSDLFPTWHRPYVALYEQTLASYFPDIIAQYSGVVRASLSDTAKTWRLPYWEWAVDVPAIPPEWISRTISIWGTNGQPFDEPNPFLSYGFKPIPPSFGAYYIPFGLFPTTLRWPSTAGADAKSRPEEVTPYLQSKDVKQHVWSVFESALTWDHFSNEGLNSPQVPGPINNLETVHNTVHNGSGGFGIAEGHMTEIPTAGFDPIFWMHHCQVERLLSLWQAINYTVKVPDVAVDAAKSLLPFRKSSTQYVTSDDIQSTTTYGYIYPEIKAAGNVSPEERSSLVYKAVETLYSGSSLFSAINASNDEAAANKVVEALGPGIEKATILVNSQQKSIRLPKLATGSTSPGADNPGHRGYELNPDTYADWIANVALEKYALGGSGSVDFFIGPKEEIPADPAIWHKSPIHVGGYDIFALQSPEGCGNCKAQQAKGLRVGGTVFLTKALIRRQIPLVGNEPETYLKENLHWRCRGRAGEIPRENVAGLEVVIQSAGYTLNLGRPDGRPQRAPWVIHPDVTRGRPGGIKEAAST